jgi:hypothetical protein
MMGLMLQSCVAWRPVQMTPQQVLDEKHPDVIRVTRTDSSKVDVYQPKIVHDTLTGHPTEQAIERLTIPLSGIREVSTRYRHVGKTMLAGLAILGGVVIYGLLQSLNQVSY